MNNETSAIRATYFSIIGNFFLCIIKWVAGFFGNSYALIADAIESTVDIFSSVMVLFGIKYSSRPADKNHPYGHGRAESLIAFAASAILLFSGGLIIYQSIENLQVPQVEPKSFTLYILGLVIVWKEYCYRKIMAKAKQTNSSSLKADAWHHRSDAITSVSAFIGVSLALVMGWQHADIWAALFAGLFISYSSIKLIRPTLAEIMDEHTHDDLITSIREVSKTVPGILDTEKCFIRKAGMKYHVDLHVIVDGDATVRVGHSLSHTLKDKLRETIPEIGHMLIHVEPNKINEASKV